MGDGFVLGVAELGGEGLRAHHSLKKNQMLAQHEITNNRIKKLHVWMF